MDGITVEVTGMNAVLTGLDNLDAAMRAKAQTAVGNAIQRTYDGSQNDCQVRSGDLKASGAMEVGNLKGSVSYGSDTVDYALPVELGHHTRNGSFVAAHPFLFPNFLAAVALIPDDLKV